METRQRMALVLDGLPRPRAQVELYEPSGSFVARLDHGYEEWQVGVEYDGEVHAQTWRADLEREQAGTVELARINLEKALRTLKNASSRVCWAGC